MKPSETNQSVTHKKDAVLASTTQKGGMALSFSQKMQQKAPAIFTCLLLLAIMVGLDQWTKWAITKNIPLDGTVVVIPGFFELTYVRNYGAAFSSFAGIGMWFFYILTIGAIIVMVYAFFKTKDSKMEFALALILAGAVGNLIDRLLFGYVRDFFRFYIFGSPFAVFNIADVCITLGFILLMFVMLYDDWKERKAAQNG